VTPSNHELKNVKSSTRYVKVGNGQPCNAVCKVEVMFCEVSTGNVIKYLFWWYQNSLNYIKHEKAYGNGIRI
jgi:hypothetical protein